MYSLVKRLQPWTLDHYDEAIEQWTNKANELATASYDLILSLAIGEVYFLAADTIGIPYISK